MDSEQTHALTLRLPASLIARLRAVVRNRGSLAASAYVRLAVIEKIERDEAARRRRTV